MHHFNRKKRELYVEEINVDALAEKYGTPLYIYSAQTILDHYNRLKSAFKLIDHQICYALKANSNLAILKLLADQGCGFDLVSGGELFRVKKAGGDLSLCTFAGVGKTREEIEQGTKAGVYSFTVESEAELDFINQIAGEMKTVASVAVRVNPQVDAKTHAKITTGTYANKFGIAFEEILPLYERASKLSHLHLRGVHIHIGSHITQLKPFVAAVKKMVPLVRELKKRYDIEFFDIGGGIGIVYEAALESGPKNWWKQKTPPLTIPTYAEALIPLLQDLNLKILLEPGRVMVGNAGILVTEVLYLKKTGKKTFVIVDAGMNDLIRPSLYEAHHEIVPLKEKPKVGHLISSDIVGPVCESGDYLAKDRPMPAFQAGDKMAVFSAGAYGFSMASNYNTRPRPAEMMVHGKKVSVIRKRETLQDLIRGESLN